MKDKSKKKEQQLEARVRDLAQKLEKLNSFSNEMRAEGRRLTHQKAFLDSTHSDLVAQGFLENPEAAPKKPARIRPAKKTSKKDHN